MLEHLGGPLVLCNSAYMIEPMSNVKLPSTQRNKTAQVNLRLRPELKSAAETAAADDQRSLTSLVEKLLTDFLRKKGYLKPRA